MAAVLLGASTSAVLAGGGVVIPAQVAERLDATQLASYRYYLTSRADFERQRDLYWKLVEERRDYRRHKLAAHQAFVLDDYMLDQPPKYAGPALTPEIAAVVASVAQASPPAEPEAQLPSLADFLAQARALYNFSPERTTEHEFKRRYAAEALAAGLSKDQVVRVYALETGGRGTYDMQAGIDPDTRQGHPISSAMGYAQLLSANSVNELVLHGGQFIARLEAKGTAAAHAKADVLRAMQKVARSVPDEWRFHQQLAKTPQGQGIHAINLDADIGPMLQAIKLKGLLETAAKEAGRSDLTGAELELMNLAGPRTGLEMMQPVGRTVPTSNFFAESGYYRNSIVRDKIGAQLLAAIEERMQAGLTKPGAVDFQLAFDEVAAGIPSRQARVAREIASPTLHETLFGGR